MQKQMKMPIETVTKPILTGSWHGKDAWKLAVRRFFSVLLIIALYYLMGMFLGFGSLGLRIAAGVIVVGIILYYQFNQGASKGEADAAFSEIMYDRQKEGKTIDRLDRQRCFHPMKGFFAALVGAAPFILFAIVFACMTKPIEYSLGMLPGWTDTLRNESQFGEALHYYETASAATSVDVMRVFLRPMIMPFINAAVLMGSSAVVLVERLSPLLVMLLPLSYGFGYTRGVAIRTRINTGIQIGDAKKKKRELKARRRRQRSNTPERLI